MSKKLIEKEHKEVLNKDAYIKLDTVLQILKCLDIASSRGAFKGNEMSFVGTLYDSLSKGLNKVFEEEINKKSETIPVDEK